MKVEIYYGMERLSKKVKRYKQYIKLIYKACLNNLCTVYQGYLSVL